MKVTDNDYLGLSTEISTCWPTDPNKFLALMHIYVAKGVSEIYVDITLT